MKRLLFIAAVFLFTASTASAQFAGSTTNEQQGVKTTPGSNVQVQKKATWGLRLGLNVASLTGMDATLYNNTSPKIGFNVGIMTDIRLHKFVGMQTGLYYSWQGVKGEGRYTNRDTYSETVNLHYFRIPVLFGFRYDFKTRVHTQLQINTGPYLAIGFLGKWKDKSGSKESEGDIFDADSGGYDFSRFDAGWDVSAGFVVKKFYLGISYDFGFVNMAKKTWGAPVRNSVFAFSIGCNF